jgi:hypothetical protein
MSEVNTHFKPFTVLVFPLGYTGEIGFFEGTKEIRVVNSAESRRLVRGRTVPVFKLVGLTLPELDQELLAAIQVAGVAIEAHTGVLQQYFEVEIDEVEAAKVVKPAGKRDILHLTFDRDLGLTDADILQVQEMFKAAIEDPHGAIITTIDGVSADILSISEGAEIRLVSAHIKDDVIYEILEQDKEPQQVVLAGATGEENHEVESLDDSDAPAV